MKSALILLVVCIFATPEESFAGLLNAVDVSRLVAGVGIAPYDKSPNYNVKANAKSDIDACAIEQFQWIDKQCEKQKCDWTLQKTHITTCKTAVRDIKNAVDTAEGDLKSKFKDLEKRFKDAIANFEKNLKLIKNQACRQLMAQIHAILSKIYDCIKKVIDQFIGSLGAIKGTQKSLL